MSSNYELLHEEGVEDTKDAERALVRRLDRRLLAFAMLGNVIKVLDNTNLGKLYQDAWILPVGSVSASLSM